MTAEVFSIPWLKDHGFVGFRRIEDLRLGRATASPLPGVYMICREHLGPVEFLESNRGGWFKGRDPSVPVDVLAAKWLDEAHVLYIGKADAGRGGRRGIRTRLEEYLRFGRGEPVGHWGGRYLWQVAGADEFLVCWKPCSSPSVEEARLLALFRSVYGALPFANLRA